MQAGKYLSLRKGEAKWFEDLILGNLVCFCPASLECDSAYDGVERGHEHIFYARPFEIVRLDEVSKAESHSELLMG